MLLRFLQDITVEFRHLVMWLINDHLSQLHDTDVVSHDDWWDGICKGLEPPCPFSISILD